MDKWKKIRLGDVCKINSNTYSIKEKWNFVNYLDTGNITDNNIESIQYIDVYKDKLPSRARRKVKKDSVIFSTVRPNQRHFGIIKHQPQNFLVSTGFVVIDVDKKYLNPDFLYYLLSQNAIVESLSAIADQSTSTYPSIKASDIENLEIHIPNLATQNNIANILSVFDKKIDVNNQINKNLEKQAKAIFEHEFLSIQNLPNGWKEGSLLNIADYLNGLAMQKYRPKSYEEGLRVLKIKELRQGFLDDNSEFCSPAIKPEYIIHDGDVIFSWSGSLLVDFWCGGICGLNQHLFKVTSTIYDKWYYYAWTKHYLKKFTSFAAAMATTMGHIKREELAKAKVLIPSRVDYDRIGKILSPLYKNIILKRIENRNLILLRDNLLNQMVFNKVENS